MRQELGLAETLSELLPDVRRLRKSELRQLLSWLRARQRIRTRLDHIYDRARRLSAGEREELTETINRILEGRAKAECQDPRAPGQASE